MHPALAANQLTDYYAASSGATTALVAIPAPIRGGPQVFRSSHPGDRRQENMHQIDALALTQLTTRVYIRMSIPQQELGDHVVVGERFYRPPSFGCGRGNDSAQR